MYSTRRLALTGRTVSEKKIFEYYTLIYTFILPPSGGRLAPEVLFFQNHKYSVHLHISIKFFPSNDILTIFPIQMHE